MNLDRASLPHCVDALVRLALDVHARWIDPQHAGDVGDHRGLVREEFGAFEDDRRVEVGNRVAAGCDAPRGFLEEDARVAGVVPRVGIGEELADVGLTQCAEEGIGDRVVQRIAIGMGDGAVGVLEGDAAQDEGSDGLGALGNRGSEGLQTVQVVAVADAEGRGWARTGHSRGVYEEPRSWRRDEPQGRSDAGGCGAQGLRVWARIRAVTGLDVA